MRTKFVLIIASLIVVTACAKKDESGKPGGSGPRPVMITTATAETKLLEVTEETVGFLESKNAPQIAAEITGRVANIEVEAGTKVIKGQLLAKIDDQDIALAVSLAQADIKRLEALMRTQSKQTQRQRNLVDGNFTSRSLLDEAESQLDALQEQLNSARLRLQQAERDLARTRIVAPITGQIEKRLIAKGDYVRPGTPVFQLAGTDELLVSLSLPERLAQKVHIGTEIELIAPLNPEHVVQGKISEVRPMIGSQNQALNVTAEISNPGGWKPGATVNARIILEKREQAIIIPELSLVRRPAGKVVYVVADGKALQRTVTVGARQRGVVEIISGVNAGEIVAFDGSTYLSDGAAVVVQEKK